jgi:DHA1 family multidrug resistance protein-like MFS transporter
MNWKIFSILFLAIFTSMMGQGLVVPLLPSFAHELGATGLYIGFIFGAFSLSRTAFLPYFGRLSDMKGRKPLITAGLFFYFLASIAYLLSQSVNHLILIRFLQGIASAMVLPIAQAYAGEITPPGREGWMMGTLNIALYGGLGGGPILGGMLKDVFNIRASFLGMGFVCISGFILCALLLPPRDQEHIRIRSKEPVNYRELFKNRYIAGIFLFRFIGTICIGTIWAFAPLFADKIFGFSSFAIGMVITLSVLMSAILMAPMGYLADNLNKLVMLGLGGFITAFAMIIFTLAREPWMLFAASIILGIGGGIAVPTGLAITVIVGRLKESMGSIMSIMIMAHSFGMIIGPILAGIMMDFIDIRIAFAGSAILMVLATLATLYMMRSLHLLEQEG